MGIMSILNVSSFNMAPFGHHQLASIMLICREVKAGGSDHSVEIRTYASSTGIPSCILNAVPLLTMEAKYLLIRACLSVVDSSRYLTNILDSSCSATLDLRSSLAQLLPVLYPTDRTTVAFVLYPCLDIVLTACNSNHVSTLSIVGFQCLESWMSRLETMVATHLLGPSVSPSSKKLLDRSVIIQKLLDICQTLINNWNHSVKQVFCYTF